MRQCLVLKPVLADLLVLLDEVEDIDLHTKLDFLGFTFLNY